MNAGPRLHAGLPEPADLRIERIGGEGDGVGRLPDGTPAYVPRVLPGERVLARPVAKRGEGWLACAEVIREPSPQRAVPPCGYFGACGGCALQHWQEAPYRAWKADLLSRALRSAGLEVPEPIPFHPGMPGERRRLDFAVRRTAAGLCFGLHAPRSAEVVDLADCLILHPRLMELIGPLRALLSGLRAIRREGSVVMNLLDAGPDLLLRVDAEPGVADRTALAALARAHALPRVSVAVGAAPPETVCQLQPVWTNLSGVQVSPPPGAFLQATADGERAMVEAVLSALPARITGKTRVAELYAGCGTLTFALAARVRVTAFEGNAAAFAALRRGISQAGLGGRIEAFQRDLRRQPLQARELSGHAAVVLDPPHAGAPTQMTQIAASGLATVIYVSCNPGTLSRDARALHASGYKLAAAVAIDQFLWSPRLESVSVFRRG